MPAKITPDIAFNNSISRPESKPVLANGTIMTVEATAEFYCACPAIVSLMPHEGRKSPPIPAFALKMGKCIKDDFGAADIL